MLQSRRIGAPADMAAKMRQSHDPATKETGMVKGEARQSAVGRRRIVNSIVSSGSSRQNSISVP